MESIPPSTEQTRQTNLKEEESPRSSRSLSFSSHEQHIADVSAVPKTGILHEDDVTEAYPPALKNPLPRLSLISMSSDRSVKYLSSMSLSSLRSLYDPVPLDNETSAKLISYTNLRQLDGAHLKTFSSACYKGDSMWICGWNTSWGFKETVLLNVEGPKYRTVLKAKQRDSKADQPAVMCPFGESILYARKGGSVVHSFRTMTKKFKPETQIQSTSILAMCTSDRHLYILFARQLNHIQVLDTNYRPVEVLATGIENVKKADVDADMWFAASADPSLWVDHPIVISIGHPGSVRVVNKTGVLWILDKPAEHHPSFSPCSVSA